MNNPATWILHGCLGGVLAAVVYDLYRLPFVLAGAPLFVVFPKFGQMLVGVDQPAWLIHTVGWAYHFSNGAALGVMYLALAALFRCRRLMTGAVVWAMGVEGVLLLTPYADFFELKMNARFIFLTASAHAVFGLALGWYCRAVLSPAMTMNLPSERDSHHATASTKR